LQRLHASQALITLFARAKRTPVLGFNAVSGLTYVGKSTLFNALTNPASPQKTSLSAPLSRTAAIGRHARTHA